MKTIFSNKTFDALKWVAIVVLPALATFVKMLFPVWEIPYCEQIASTIVAVDFLLGALLGVSTVQYDRARATAAESEAQEMRDIISLDDTFENFGGERDE